MPVPAPTNPTQGSPEAQQAQNQAAGASNKSGDANASTMIRTVQDLKQKAPELYKATLQGIAWTVIRQVRRSARRLKEIQRKARERN